MRALPILDHLRRYGLAVACVLAPVLLVNCGIDFAVGTLVKHQLPAQLNEHLPQQPQDQQQQKQASPSALPRGFTYKLNDTPPPAQDANTKPAEAKPAPEMRATELYARHIAGRYAFSVGSGFVYVVALIAVLFSATVIWQRKGWWGVGAAVAFACVLATYVTRNVDTFPYARTLVMDGIFAAADRHDDLKLLRVDGKSTAESVNRLMEIGTFVGVGAVAMLIAVFVLTAVRPDNPTLDDLKRRLREIRVALVLASTILVLYVLVSKMLLQWSLSLLADTQLPAFQKIADAVLLHWSASATVALLLMFLPAMFAWWLDVEAYRRASPPADSGAAPDGLQFAPLKAVTSIAIALAPILVSPFADTLKSVIKALPLN